MLPCPSCQTQLAREKSPEGVFWRCPGCEGRLLAVPVARKLLAKKLVNNLWIASGDITLDRNRECPLCKNKMVQTLTLKLSSASFGAEQPTVGAGAQVLTSPTEHPVHVDVCRACYTIWFDTHELAELCEAAPINPVDVPANVKEKRMPEKAREMLAMFKVERIRERKDPADVIVGTPPEENWKTIFSVLGLPVEEDKGPLQRAPLVTWGLGILMVLVFALSHSNLYHWIHDWGLIPNQATRHYGLTFLSSIFLHADFWHLLGNLYFFLIFADNVEDYLGKSKFLILFFLAALAGDALDMAFDPRGDLPLVGASAAISGVMVFYALQFPKAKLCLLFSYYLYFRWIRLPAWCAFLIWAGLQTFIILDQIHGIGHVSGLAHAGGIAAGALIWLIHRNLTQDKEKVFRLPSS